MSGQIQRPKQLFDIAERKQFLFKAERSATGEPLFILCERRSGEDVQGHTYHFGVAWPLGVGNKSFSNNTPYDKVKDCEDYLDVLADEIAEAHACLEDVEYIGEWKGTLEASLKPAPKKKAS